MTINAGSTGRTEEYLANGSQTVFSFPFPILRTSEVDVFIDGVRVDGGYVVTSSPAGGGSVTFAAAPAAGTRVIIVDTPDVSQERDYANQTGVWPSDIENSLDKLTRIARRLTIETKRALKVPLDAVGVDRNVAPGLAGSVPVWDSTGGLGPGPLVSDITAAVDYVRDARDEMVLLLDETAPLVKSFSTRAAAQSAVLPSTATYIEVDGLLYKRDALGTALTTAGGVKWAPVGAKTVAHFGGDVAAAHAWQPTKPVHYGSTLWPNDSPVGYLNGLGASHYRRAQEDRVQLGLAASPVNDPNPLYASVKFSSTVRADHPGAWDHTGYFGLIKRSGDAYGAALVGAARAEGGSGDWIGVHGRSHSSANGVGNLFGMWGYVSYDAALGLPAHMSGLEVNVVNKSGNSTFDMVAVGASAGSRGVAAVVADGGKRAQTGFSVERTGPSEGWMLGIRIRADAITPSAAGLFTAAMRVEGGLSAATSYGGITFEGAYLDYGLDFTRLAQPFQDSNTAIRLRENDRITFGGQADNHRYIARPAGQAALNFNNLHLWINGLRVVAERQPALPAPATDLASALTLLNAIRETLRQHGLVEP